jgi:hypothetical protein
VLLVGTVMTKPPVLQRQFATPPVDETKSLDALCNTARSEKRRLGELLDDKFDTWPAPGSEDSELGVFMGAEVSHGETKVYAGVQA